MVNFSWAGATDVGRMRRVNQDAVLPDDVGLGPGPVVVAVADGLGGYAGSEVAARLVVDALASADVADFGPEELVDAAHRRLVVHIESIAAQNPGLVNMSTTLSLAVLRPGGLVEIGHVGDSRVYGSDGGGMARLTSDHTVAMDLVRTGHLTESEAMRHPGWHTMSNWLGRTHPYWVETRELVCGVGDRLLLCSDGLTNMVPEPAILSLLHSGTPDEVCARLIASANQAGGVDNISVVVVAVEP